MSEILFDNKLNNNNNNNNTNGWQNLTSYDVFN